MSEVKLGCASGEGCKTQVWCGSGKIGAARPHREP